MFYMGVVISKRGSYKAVAPDEFSSINISDYQTNGVPFQRSVQQNHWNRMFTSNSKRGQLTAGNGEKIRTSVPGVGFRD